MNFSWVKPPIPIVIMAGALSFIVIFDKILEHFIFNDDDFVFEMEELLNQRAGANSLVRDKPMTSEQFETFIENEARAKWLEASKCGRLLELETKLEMIPELDCTPYIWPSKNHNRPSKALSSSSRCSAVPSKVLGPIWIGLFFPSQARCKIISPTWMSTGALMDVKRDDKIQALETGSRSSSELSLSLSHMIGDKCPEGELDGDDIQMLLKFVWEAQAAKLRYAYTTYRPNGDKIEIDKMAQMEMCIVRPAFIREREEHEAFLGIDQTFALG